MSVLGDDLLKGAQAASKFLGIPVRQIYRLTELGKIPHYRVGGALFYRKSELEALFSGSLDAVLAAKEPKPEWPIPAAH